MSRENFRGSNFGSNSARKGYGAGSGQHRGDSSRQRSFGAKDGQRRFNDGPQGRFNDDGKRRFDSSARRFGRDERQFDGDRRFAGERRFEGDRSRNFDRSERGFGRSGRNFERGSFNSGRSERGFGHGGSERGGFSRDGQRNFDRREDKFERGAGRNFGRDERREGRGERDFSRGQGKFSRDGGRSFDRSERSFDRPARKFEDRSRGFERGQGGFDRSERRFEGDRSRSFDRDRGFERGGRPAQRSERDFARRGSRNQQFAGEREFGRRKFAADKREIESRELETRELAGREQEAWQQDAVKAENRYAENSQSSRVELESASGDQVETAQAVGADLGDAESGGAQTRSYSDNRFERGDSYRRPRTSQYRRGQENRPRYPYLDESIDPKSVGRETWRAMRSLSKDTSERVGRHLVMMTQLIDQDPELAWRHAQAAEKLAGRIGAVREAVGLGAYQLGHYQEALSNLRAFRRIGGHPEAHWPLEADCLRGLGRVDKALEVIKEASQKRLLLADQLELLLVESGIYADRGESDKGLALLSTKWADSFTGELKARLLMVKAERLDEVGQTEAASRARDEAMAINPELIPDDESLDIWEEELPTADEALADGETEADIYLSDEGDDEQSEIFASDLATNHEEDVYIEPSFEEELADELARLDTVDASEPAEGISAETVEQEAARFEQVLEEKEQIGQASSREEI